MFLILLVLNTEIKSSIDFDILYKSHDEHYITAQHPDETLRLKYNYPFYSFHFKYCDLLAKKGIIV